MLNILKKKSLCKSVDIHKLNISKSQIDKYTYKTQNKLDIQEYKNTKYYPASTKE